MNIRPAGRMTFTGLICLGVFSAQSASAQVLSRNPAPGLAATSWQLVEFEGGDGRRLIPDDRSKYTVAFGTDGRVSVRIDCNRGSGTWRSAGTSQLTFGPLALTRMLCPRGSLHDQIVRQWPYVRTYTLRNGHLFLSLMADGGIYEFEPLNGTSAPQARSVTGTAFYRERIALPANAVFEVSLEEVATRGAPAGLIARVRNEQPGNPPIPFVIAYDPGRISPNRSYVVRARILVEEQQWFATGQTYPVLTGGRGSDVQLLLQRRINQGPTGRVPGAIIAPFENTYWRLTDLGSTPARIVAQRAPNFTLHSANKTVTGSGGCNRISGTYLLRGDRITFGRFTSTMMACSAGMDIERAYLNALARSVQWRIAGQRLELLDSRGVRVAGFDAVTM